MECYAAFRWDGPPAGSWSQLSHWDTFAPPSPAGGPPGMHLLGLQGQLRVWAPTPRTVPPAQLVGRRGWALARLP